MTQPSVRSGLSLWQASGLKPIPFPPLEGDVECDVAVVGGGITGTLVGHYLIQAGVDTVIVDKGEVGAGSTAASTGLLQYEIDMPLVDLIRLRGEHDAVHVYRRGLNAVSELEQLACKLDCGFSRRSALCFASQPSHVSELRREYECRRDFGFDLEYLERAQLAELSSIDAPAALYSAGDGQLDPYRFTQALLQESNARGLRAFSQVEVTDIAEGPSSVVLSAGTKRIRSRAVMFCTGYWSPSWLEEQVAVLRTTYVVASRSSKPFAGWPEGCLVWETARPYLYARQTDDGRAIIGGEDTPSARDHTDDALLASKRVRLVERFGTLFPGATFTPDCAWAGTFAETKDGLPYIGSPAGSGLEHQRVYFALGYGGNGITSSVIAASLLSDLFLGRPNADAAVFRFGR